MWNREPSASCAFCARETLAYPLAETEHFFLLADHAPLVEGHLLIIPRAHHACYGALPMDLEDELLALKARVRAFFVARYQTPAFFEHGVFRQTVPHAHLHALPFGALAVDLPALAAEGGRVARSLEDLRRWYAEHGHYFYLEQPHDGAGYGEAAIFPPVEARYFAVLAALRQAAGRLTPFQPQPVRRALGAGRVHALAAAWHAYEAEEGDGENGSPRSAQAQ
jgi:diadenosine tetraphosphate (Ap4A) HIT family hydrolase